MTTERFSEPTRSWLSHAFASPTAAQAGAWEAIGSAEIVFSHIDQNRSGLAFPEENFVFGENFRTLLRGAGLDRAMAAAKG